jgi:hypothetical protein
MLAGVGCTLKRIPLARAVDAAMSRVRLTVSVIVEVAVAVVNIVLVVVAVDDAVEAVVAAAVAIADAVAVTVAVDVEVTVLVKRRVLKAELISVLGWAGRPGKIPPVEYILIQ